MEYVILEAFHCADLEVMVMNNYEDGFTLQGGVSVSISYDAPHDDLYERYCQAMVRNV